MRTILGIGVSLGLMLIAPAAKADCICVEMSPAEILCFTVLPGPRCPGDKGGSSGDGGAGGSFDVLPYGSLPGGGGSGSSGVFGGGSGGGGAGGNRMELEPMLQLKNFKSQMQGLQTPMIGGGLN